MYISTHDDEEWHAITEDGVYQVMGVDRKTGLALGGGGGGLIASVAKCESKEDRIANANLIAAAPDLLKSLVIMTDWAEAGMFCNPSNDELEEARAAIEKALFGVEKDG